MNEKYSQRQFSTLTGIARATLQLWAKNGKLAPAIEINGKKFYSDEQKEIALRLYSSKNTSPTATDVPEQNVGNLTETALAASNSRLKAFREVAQNEKVTNGQPAPMSDDNAPSAVESDADKNNSVVDTENTSPPETSLIVREENLPTTLEDLSKFVLVGRDKLNAVRAEISAIKNLGLAREVREQKLAEGQEIGKLVIWAEARLGELFNQMPKTQGGDRRSESFKLPSTGKFESDATGEDKLKPKLEVAADMGFNKNQVAQFQQLADNPAAVQKAIEDARSRGEIVTRSSALAEIKQAKKDAKQEERRERKSYTPPIELPANEFKLICADIRSGLPDVADNSVDFIITDPPYPKEYLPLYEDLSKLAARVLKDGGSLICMVGQSYLPEVIQLLATSMNYHWCLCYSMPGQKTQLWQRHLHTSWKPLLWFVKSDYKGDWLGDDVMTSPSKDKEFHEWGQSLGGTKDIIERMTNPNDVILDPFLGGGTTGVAALTCKRKFIGVDIKQGNIDIAKARIWEAFSNDK